MLCLLTCVPLSQENSVDGQKLTPTLGSPNATKTNPPKKKDGPLEQRDGFRVAVNRRMTGWMNWPSGWMDDCTDLREASEYAFTLPLLYVI